jgi:hypothetical protein
MFEDIFPYYLNLDYVHMVQVEHEHKAKNKQTGVIESSDG